MTAEPITPPDRDTIPQIVAAAGRARSPLRGGCSSCFCVWEGAVRYSRNDLFPGPREVGLGNRGVGPQRSAPEVHRRFAVPRDLGVLAGGLDRRPVRSPARLVPAGLPGVQSVDPGAAADLADRLDSAGHPLVRRLRRSRRSS